MKQRINIAETCLEDIKKGFTLLRNVFTPAGQRHWILRCLLDLPNKPNITNLDALNLSPTPPDTVWGLHTNCDKKSVLIQKLRWVTLGYHHNWDTKEYDPDNVTPFPEDLSSLCSTIATAIGYPDFKPEAAIVNYYHADSTLSFHVDYSEICQTSPIFSISLGQSAVFLLGGVDRTTKPVAMYLHHGDIAVMAGPSRMAYHAVPRILPTGQEPWMEGLSGDDCDDVWVAVNKYLETARININVRQVYPQ